MGLGFVSCSGLLLREAERSRGGRGDRGTFHKLASSGKSSSESWYSSSSSFTDFRTGAGCKEPRREEGRARGAKGDRFWLDADGENLAAECVAGAEDGDTERDRSGRGGGVEVLPPVNRRPLFIIRGSSVPLGYCPDVFLEGGMACLLWPEVNSLTGFEDGVADFRLLMLLTCEMTRFLLEAREPARERE
jgi:hypothetical protein